MRLTEATNFADGETIMRFEIHISDYEKVMARLHLFDLALYRECMASESIADKLLWLETLARRIEESESKEAHK